MDLKTNQRSDFNRELLAEGLGNLVAGFFGGVTSTGNATGAVSNYTHGALAYDFVVGLNLRYVNKSRQSNNQILQFRQSA